MILHYSNSLEQMIILFTLSAVLSAIVIRFAISAALTHGIADHPGGHKQHDTITPFVGGIGILVALSVALIMLLNIHPEQSTKWLSLGLGALIIFATGFADDLLQLNYKVRLIIQATVALIMTIAGGVVLSDLGNLLPGLTLELGLLAIPFTVFATIGGINALNMIDGIDGLAGTVSFVSLLLISAVAFITNDSPNFTLAVALASGTAGFLYFNLRYASQRRAKVFLGDNGSMLLGFLFAWLLVDLSQGSSPAITPVTAIWLFSIPLMDTISVMLRRVWLRKSPFTPDHNHLHHILLHAGFRIEDTVFSIASLHLLFGAIGLAGLYLGIPEFVMLLVFLIFYMGYFYVTLRPWYFIIALRHLHTLLGLIPAEKHGVFLGSYTAKEAENLVRLVSKELGPSVDSWVQVLEQRSPHWNTDKRYAVAVNIRLVNNECVTSEEMEQYVVSLKKRMMKHCGIQVRQFVERSSKNERRIHNQGNPAGNELRVAERRNPDSGSLVFEAMFDKLGRYLPSEVKELFSGSAKQPAAQSISPIIDPTDKPSGDSIMTKTNQLLASSDIVWHHATVTRARREALNGHRGAILWFTGLSGAGKSTLAHAVEESLHQRGYRTFVLDGDNVRHGLCSDLGFTPENRVENIRRIGEVAKLFMEAGTIVLTAFISPFRAERERIRSLVEQGDFIEIYCNSPIQVCESRDVKGLYQKARAGQITEFTGISSPYEAPQNPELTVNTGTTDLEICVQQVMEGVKRRGIIRYS